MEFENDTNYLDQHFLIDKHVINTLIDTCNLKLTDNVVEIGPGNCVLSNIIAPRVNSLLLIEKDNRLTHYINVLMDKNNNTEVIYDNVLDFYIPKCDKIVSALPYSITEPFIEKLLRCDFDEAILIVGDNYASNVRDKKINKLSLLTNSFFDFEYIESITPDSFEPRPRVMSALIKLKKKTRYDLIADKKMFIIRELLFNRDRKLKNNLVESFIEYEKCLGNKLTKKESKLILSNLNIDNKILNKNMEELSNDYYEMIYNLL